MSGISQLFTDEQQSMIIEDMCVLLKIYSRETIPKIHHYEYDKYLWNDIYSHIHIQLQHLFDDSIQDICYKLYQKARAKFYTPEFPMRCNGNTYETPVNVKAIAKQIEKIKNKPQPEQRTKEWYEFRHNLITASNAWKALGTQSSKNQLIYEKCAPLDLNKYKETFGDTPMNWGKKYEDVSVLVYEKLYKTKVDEFGCVPHDKYSFLAASPDGINTDPSATRFGRMLEIKNVFSRELTGIPKLDYWIQTQLQMEVCDLNECDFLETNFMEYETREQFIMDGTFTRTESGKQKGIMLYFVNEGKAVYKYAPLDLSETEYAEWEDNMMIQCETYQWIKTIYWRLESMSNVLILRHQPWIDWAIPQIKTLWETVEKERGGDITHRAPKKREKKTKSTGCMLTIETETTKTG